MRRISNNIISIFVVVVVLFLILPLPTQLMDILIIFNISLSIVILLITMNISDALEFSIFPSLLLVTTLFRLALNVSSTRLILSNGGYAGTVIKAFGQLITRGNIVIGIIIFLIIVLMQFIVITKGAERVAEVAARFTLDAMMLMYPIPSISFACVRLLLCRTGSEDCALTEGSGCWAAADGAEGDADATGAAWLICTVSGWKTENESSSPRANSSLRASRIWSESSS